MKAISVVLLVLASMLLIHFALGASSDDLPRGVSPGNWIPVSDKMGFVVTTPHVFPPPANDKQALLVSAPTEGYFMVRMGDSWQRIVIKEPLIGPTG